jgi:DMSO/TMAO reductase YedYZ molybdopterin-dependent catalytic subunit
MTARAALVFAAAALAACSTPSAPTAPAPLSAAPADSIELTGAVPRPTHFDRAALEAMGTVTGTWKHKERQHSFRGVPLDIVLAHGGFSPGDMDAVVPKRDKAVGWKMAVLATAADGFQTVFSCGELLPSMGPTRAFVVWELDGAPLPDKQGPFRLVVTTDRLASRSLSSVRSLRVLDLRDAR